PSLPPTSTLFPYTTLFRSQELIEGERLGQVVVGAEIEAHDLVGHAIARSQDEDGRLHVLAPRLPEHLETVALGQHEIEDDQIVGDRKSTRLNSSHEWISYA